MVLRAEFLIGVTMAGQRVLEAVDKSQTWCVDDGTVHLLMGSMWSAPIPQSFRG